MDSSEQSATPDAPDQETMEQIRQRRVQKLGALTASKSNEAEIPQPSSTNAQAATRGPSNLQQSAADKETEEKAGSPGDGKRRATGEMDPADSAPRKQAALARTETIEEYSDKVLTTIFRMTVDPSRETEIQGHQLAYLPDLSKELLDADTFPTLSTENLAQALIEAATALSHDRPLLEYFIPCWKRAIRALKTLRGPAPEKEGVLKEARRLCFGNCILSVTTPELFGREPNPLHDTLVPYLLRSFDSDYGIDMEFYSEAIAGLKEDDSIEPMFTKAMMDLSNKLSSMCMDDDYKPYMNALMAYSKFPPLLNALARHPCFQMAQSAPAIEKLTILGPFFRISPLQGEVTRAYFASPRSLDKSRVQSAQNALQITLNTHQAELKSITNAFIRASAEARNKVLDWFAYIMNTNHKRRALQVDPREVSSDGFMINVTVVLDFLCEPFMDSTFSKVDRIDVDYFKRNPRVDITDETKLNADQQQSDAFYANKVGGVSNFITEIFFLTLAAHHYGSEATNAKLKNLEKEIKHYEKQIVRLEAERPKFLNDPAQLRLYDVSLKRHTDVLEKSMSLKFAIEGVLRDEKMQGRSLQFMRYVSVWLLRLASQSAYTPEKPLQLPLPASQPEAFSCLPEYALQDVLDNFKFVFRYVPQIILSAVGDEMIALCITFLESSEYIRNPYLKSSLVSLLFSGTWPTYHLRRGVLGDLLTNTKFANDYLLHAVMKFYVECESTGAHTQFYDKFNIRYEIFQVIKCVWSNDTYKQQLTDQSMSNRTFFVQFVNLLMNDATYVLDEGLSKFPKIKELAEALKDASLSPDDRKKREEELGAAEGQAQSYMQLANETVAMMKLFTSAMSEAFTMPEIVVRLAGMLDYNLEILTGPKSTNLKVENPEKYHFSPKTLMPELVDIYLNLGSSTAFIEAVAADGRSYKPQTFLSTTRILRNRQLKDESTLQAWEVLCTQFATAKERFDQDELDVGNAPDEFEDQIMGELMKDPVILPSNHVVDRSTITQHLLSDQKDPFTRQPMTIDDVVPHDELRGRIEAWKAERLAQVKKSRDAAAGGVDAMDTTD